MNRGDRRDRGEILFKEVSEKVIVAAIEVHRELGPGLLESVYESCMQHELVNAGVAVERQVPITVHYKGVAVDCGFRADLIVEHKILVELKAVDALAPIHQAQVLTYLKLSGLQVGLLINFNATSLRHGIQRLVRSLPPRSPRSPRFQDTDNE